MWLYGRAGSGWSFLAVVVGSEKYFSGKAWPGPMVLLNSLAKLKFLVCDLEGVFCCICGGRRHVDVMQ